MTLLDDELAVEIFMSPSNICGSLPFKVPQLNHSSWNLFECLVKTDWENSKRVCKAGTLKCFGFSVIEQLAYLNVSSAWIFQFQNCLNYELCKDETSVHTCCSFCHITFIQTNQANAHIATCVCVSQHGGGSWRKRAISLAGLWPHHKPLLKSVLWDLRACGHRAVPHDKSRRIEISIYLLPFSPAESAACAITTCTQEIMFQENVTLTDGGHSPTRQQGFAVRVSRLRKKMKIKSRAMETTKTDTDGIRRQFALSSAQHSTAAEAGRAPHPVPGLLTCVGTETRQNRGSFEI